MRVEKPRVRTIIRTRPSIAGKCWSPLIPTSRSIWRRCGGRSGCRGRHWEAHRGRAADWPADGRTRIGLPQRVRRGRRLANRRASAERNILKVVRSLFLDEFRAEFAAARKDKSGRGKSRLLALQKKLAALPTVFGEIRQPQIDYLLVPKVSSERRKYLPIGYATAHVIANGSSLIVLGGNVYHFGILTSSMHMAWMRQAAQRGGGRRPARARRPQAIHGSAGILPAASGIPAGRRAKAAGENANATEMTGADARPAHESFRQDARAPQSTLADLYDPLAMPPALAAAHTALDKAVDRCYRSEAFPSDRARVEHLFALYEKLTAPLAPTAPTRRKRAKG